MTATALVPQNFGAVSSVFAGRQPDNDLAAGVEGGYGHIGYKGKVWSIRYRGEERQLMRPDGDGPRGSIEVVILKAPPFKSKIWYENGYSDGSNAAPDCFSANGVTPEASSAKKQSNVCATCPKNVWGSGKEGRGKACADSKRLAIAPAQDIKNEAFGGPMLLRVPAASLQDMADFADKMNALGYPYYSFITKVAFDPAESYPKFKFSPERPLTDEEGKLVLELREDKRVARITAESDVPATPAAALPAPSVFNQPQLQVVQPVVQPVVTPVVTPTPVAVAPVAVVQPVQPAAVAPVAAVAAPQADPFGGVSVAAGAAAVAAVAPAAAAQPVAAPGPVTPAEQSFDDKLNALLGAAA